MIKLLDEKYIICSSSRLIFNERLDYITEILNQVSNDFKENEEQLEDIFWKENGIPDIIELSKDDFEMYNSQLETFKDRHKHLPQILYKSLMVSIYSIIETTLSELISSTENLIDKKIKFKHLKNNGNNIENYINYFNLVHNLSFTDLKSLLSDLKNYADIRNNIVHFNGNLKDDNQNRRVRIIKFIKNDTTIEIDKNENIFINNSKFVFNFLDLTRKFGYELFNSYKINN